MIFSNNHSVISNKLYQENRWITLPETKINYKSVRSDTGLSSPSSGSSSSSSWSDHWVSRTRLLAALLTNCEKKARTELALGSQHWLSHSHRVVWSTVCLDHVLISLSHLSSLAPYSSHRPQFLTRLWWQWTQARGPRLTRGDICGPTVDFLYPLSLATSIIVIVLSRDSMCVMMSHFPPAPEYHLYF